MQKLSPEERLERHREACRRYRREHPDKILEAGRKYREEHPEIYIKASRKWNEAHREEIRKLCLKRYYAKRDECMDAQRKWRKENPDKHGEQSRRWKKSHHEECLAQLHAQRKVALADVCERCGEKATLRHHPDYSKPLDVVHLCAQCHCDIHKREEKKDG